MRSAGSEKRAAASSRPSTASTPGSAARAAAARAMNEGGTWTVAYEPSAPWCTT